VFNASMQFDLGEDVAAMREMVHRWAQERVKPMAAEIDSKNEFPPELWTEMGELGLLGMTVEEEFGGSGLGYVAHTVAVEEIARASATVRAEEREEMIRKVRYSVRRGDSLHAIANRFNVSVNQIRDWNDRLEKSRYLQPGDNLTLYVDVRNAP
jgi:LysM repeat protein